MAAAEVRRETNRPKTAPARHTYGEYQNVLLSDEELEKLKRDKASREQRLTAQS